MNTIVGTLNKGESSRTFNWSSIYLRTATIWTSLNTVPGWWFPLQVSRSCSAAVLQCPGSVAAGGVDRQRWRAASQKSVRKEGCDAGWAARETIHRQTSLFLLSLTWKFRRWLLCLNDYNLIQHESLLRITNLPHQVTHFWWLVCVTKVCSLVQRTFCRQSDTSHVRDISTWHVTRDTSVWWCHLQTRPRKEEEWSVGGAVCNLKQRL